MKAHPCLVGLCAVFAALFVGRCFGQDVIVTNPVWALDGPAPDELPKAHLSPGFPSEMKAATEPGYVIVLRYIALDDKIRKARAIATHIPFQRAVEAEFVGWELSPAKRGGEKVPGEVWFAVIFNPKTAGTKLPNAAARLLAVSPIIVPKSSLDKEAPAVVRVKFNVDETGKITAAVPTTDLEPTTDDALQQSLAKWRFAPARKEGKAVSSEFTMSVVCQAATETEMQNYTPPRVLKRAPAAYPRAMLASRMVGEVAVRFEVEADGSMKNPVVTRSNNPGFDSAAIEALRHSKFAPATRDGKAVKASMTVTIKFNLNSNNPGFVPNDAYTVSGPVNTSKLPPELRYDTAAKVRGTVVPIYPYTQLHDKVRGSATVSMVIDAEGHVIGTKVTSSTCPEFGSAVVAALETFSFDPALRRAQAVPSVLRFSQEFGYSEASQSDPDNLLSLERNHPEKIVRADALDQPPRPVSQKAPVFPRSLLGKTDRGQAVIEVLIDSTGHARLPRVVSATQEAFGYSGVQAVSAWIFDAPKVAGKRVITRVQVPLSFVGPAVVAEKTLEVTSPPETAK